VVTGIAAQLTGIAGNPESYSGAPLVKVSRRRESITAVVAFSGNKQDGGVGNRGAGAQPPLNRPGHTLTSAIHEDVAWHSEFPNRPAIQFPHLADGDGFHPRSPTSTAWATA
jgi:hypothetical protein